MIVLYSPVFSEEDSIEYSFDTDIINAKMGSSEDVFDFSNFPDGEAIIENIATVLPRIPILRAHRIDGELYVTLLCFIPFDAPFESRFPEPFEVGG